MINILQGFSLMGFIIGVASLAGAVELDRPALPAIVLTLVSIILVFIFEEFGVEIERKKRNKKHKRFH